MTHDAYRILDANFNRASEALRVMEEYARFVLNDDRLCQDAKSMRHRLAGIFREKPLASCMVMRDTPADVGTRSRTDAEYQRSRAVDVAAAAGKRLSEALRVIEEYAKPVDCGAATACEKLRYDGYELDKRIMHVVRARSRWPGVDVYVLLTESLCAESWRDTLKAVIDGGADCVQLREKACTDRDLFERAEVFCQTCREAGVLSIINDRVDLAAAVGADGVHLGATDLSPPVARRILGPHAIIGASSHSADEAKAAADLSADYIAVGPMFATPVKPQYGVNGPDLVRIARAVTALPLVAIGGINADNVCQVVEAGADSVAVCRAIIGAADPAAALRRIRRAAGFEQTRPR